MTKLKTLKDMKLSPHVLHSQGTGFNRCKKELREEAIRWTKQYEKICDGCGPEYLDRMMYQSIAEWIRHFFNITEEDING